MSPNTLFHIISKSEAESAKLDGFYKPSSLEEDGFIHCAYANQITRIADFLFVGQTDLVILEIEKSRVGCAVIDEDLYEGDEDFPHIYGVLPWQAVVAIHDFPCLENGMFELPASIGFETRVSTSQLELWTQIQAASKALESDQIVYVSEYLGYLPFGVYHWCECAGQDISTAFPTGWQQADLLALENAGLLVKLETWQNPDDEFETKTMYKVCPEESF